MNIIFAGTPDFAAVCLAELVKSDHEVVAVFTQPDRPAGRGRKRRPSPVKQLALEQGIEVYQPTSLKGRPELDLIEALAGDVMIVAAYGLMLPKSVLEIPAYGCVNIHASLLPRWRGAAPIQRAIEAGDTQTGVTIMQMDEGLDTGAMLAWDEVAITQHDTASRLHDKLAVLGGALIIKVLNQLERAQINATQQDDSKATYAHKLTREDAVIDWNLTARAIVDKIRAFNPRPGVKVSHKAGELKLLMARLDNAAVHGRTGEIFCEDSRILFQCKDALVELLALQKPGGRPMTAAEFLNGYHFAPGERFS